ARGRRPLLGPGLPRGRRPLPPPGRGKRPGPRGRGPPRERRPRRRRPHPEHHPRHEPRRRRHRLARGRRGGLDRNRAPRLPHAAPRRGPPLRPRPRPRLPPGNRREDRSRPHPAHPPRGALPRGLDGRHGAAARGDKRPGPRTRRPYARGRRPVRRERPRGRAGDRRGHVRLYRPQVGAGSRRNGRVLRKARPPGPQPERRLPVALGPDRLRQRRRLRAPTRRPALRGVDHERGPRRRLRRSGGRHPRTRGGGFPGDPPPGGPSYGPVIRASARPPPLAEARAWRVGELRDRGRRGQGGGRTPARAEVRPALRPRPRALRPGEHAPLQHRRRTGGPDGGRREAL
ncbi:MAG: Cysteine desulfurase, partial [uncultured Rubrobacteraceae bacterium]